MSAELNDKLLAELQELLDYPERVTNNLGPKAYHARVELGLELVLKAGRKLLALKVKARECVGSQGEILCDACESVTRELRDDPDERPCPHTDGDRQCGSVGNEPCKTWRGDTFLDGTRHEERDA